jgi:hypothetical protein
MLASVVVARRILMRSEPFAMQDALVSPRSLRLAGAAGLLFLATFIVQFILGPQAPQYDAPTSDIVRYYTGHQTGIALVTSLVGIFGVLYGIFLAGVWGALRRSSAAWLATLGLVAGVSDTILLLVGNAIHVALASYLTSTPGADGNTIVPLFKVASLLTMLLNTWIEGLALLAFSGGLLLSGILAGRRRWLAWSGLLAAVLYLIGGLAVFDPTGPIRVATVLGAVPWFVWLAGLSVGLVRGTPAPAVLPRATAPAPART